MNNNANLFKDKVKIFEDLSSIKKSLDCFSREYRSINPGNYLYKLLINRNSVSLNNLLSDEYLELVYITLIAWNMNQRAAVLTDYDEFKKIIQKQSNNIANLIPLKIESITQYDSKLLNDIFIGLEKICKQKSKVVTISKTLHFLLPNLFVPIDRKYTISFFRSKGVKTGSTDIPDSIEDQYALFVNILDAYKLMSSYHNYEQFKNDKWNQNVPKILDNVVIGHVLGN